MTPTRNSNSSPNPGADSGAKVITPAELFSYWEQVREGIKALVAPVAQDPEAYNWRPEGSKTSIDWILRHLATVEDFWVGAVIHGGSFALRRRQDFPDLASILADLDETHARSVATLQDLSMEELVTKRRLVPDPSPYAGSEMTLLQIFSFLVDHDCHHRGQLQLLLRLMGREPDDRYLEF